MTNSLDVKDLSPQEIKDTIQDIVNILSEEYQENRKKLCITIITSILLLLYYIPSDRIILGALRIFYFLYFLHHVGWYGGRWIGIYSPIKGQELKHGIILTITAVYALYFIPNTAFYFINILVLIAYAVAQKPTHKYIRPKGSNKIKQLLSLYGW